LGRWKRAVMLLLADTQVRESLVHGGVLLLIRISRRRAAGVALRRRRVSRLGRRRGYWSGLRLVREGARALGSAGLRTGVWLLSLGRRCALLFVSCVGRLLGCTVLLFVAAVLGRRCLRSSWVSGRRRIRVGKRASSRRSGLCLSSGITGCRCRLCRLLRLSVLVRVGCRSRSGLRLLATLLLLPLREGSFAVRC